MRPVTINSGLAASLAVLGDTGARWRTALPATLAGLETDWRIRCGAARASNTGYVADAVSTVDGRALVVKVALPEGIDGFGAHRQEIAALRAADGDPYVALLNADAARGATLLERLGPALSTMDLPIAEQRLVTARTLARGWRPLASDRLPSGRAKAAALIDFVTAGWRATGEACDRGTIDRALGYARDRAEHAHRDRTVLVHGDAHAHNVLRRPGTDDFALIDPEGLASEPAHDLGVVLRDHNEELLADPDGPAAAVEHCRRLAAQTGVPAGPIWRWSFLERVSSGLFLHQLGRTSEARPFLRVADRLASLDPF